MSKQKPIQILLVNERNLMRESLATLLSKRADFRVVQADAGKPAEAILQCGQTDLVLLDPPHSGSSGLSLIPHWHRRFPRVRILLLLGILKPAAIRHALDAGAVGCVSKFDATSDLFAAIHRTALHNEVFSPSVRRLMLSLPSGSPGGLTKRENEILRLVAGGMPSRKMALALGLSPKTIDRHKENLKEKLHLSSASDLSRHAFRLFPHEEQ